jgi:hypothetical protein
MIASGTIIENGSQILIFHDGQECEDRRRIAPDNGMAEGLNAARADRVAHFVLRQSLQHGAKFLIFRDREQIRVMDFAGSR